MNEMLKWKRLPARLRTSLLVVVLLLSLFVGVTQFSALASPCSTWSHCPISQYYGQNYEHGVDLLTHGLPITALLSGTVTFDRWECWSGECIQDITWKLDQPYLARGQHYAYVQIANSRVRVGQHIWGSTILGYSGSFMEYGLTPDWAYGVSGWHWGTDPRFLL